MTISREYGEYTVTCDICGEPLGDGEVGATFDDFDEAVTAARHAGWQARRNLNGEWENLCPSCQ